MDQVRVDRQLAAIDRRLARTNARLARLERLLREAATAERDADVVVGPLDERALMQHVGRVFLHGDDTGMRAIAGADGSSYFRYPQEDRAWVIVHVGNDGDTTGMWYEDKHGHRTPVTLDEQGNLVLAEGADRGRADDA